eukprot:121421_1
MMNERVINTEDGCAVCGYAMNCNKCIRRAFHLPADLERFNSTTNGESSVFEGRSPSSIVLDRSPTPSHKPCDYCNRVFETKMMKDHLDKECVKYCVNCPYKCIEGMVIPRKDIVRHLSECPRRSNKSSQNCQTNESEIVNEGSDAREENPNDLREKISKLQNLSFDLYINSTFCRSEKNNNTDTNPGPSDSEIANLIVAPKVVSPESTPSELLECYKILGSLKEDISDRNAVNSLAVALSAHQNEREVSDDIIRALSHCQVPRDSALAGATAHVLRKSVRSTEIVLAACEVLQQLNENDECCRSAIENKFMPASLKALGLHASNKDVCFAVMNQIRKILSPAGEDFDAYRKMFIQHGGLPTMLRAAHEHKNAFSLVLCVMATARKLCMARTVGAILSCDDLWAAAIELLGHASAKLVESGIQTFAKLVFVVDTKVQEPTRTAITLVLLQKLMESNILGRVMESTQ